MNKFFTIDNAWEATTGSKPGYLQTVYPENLTDRKISRVQYSGYNQVL